MRWLLALLLVMGGCGDRREFDQRYEDTAGEIENRARELDNQVNAAEPAPAKE